MRQRSERDKNDNDGTSERSERAAEGISSGVGKTFFLFCALTPSTDRIQELCMRHNDETEYIMALGSSALHATCL